MNQKNRTLQFINILTGIVTLAGVIFDFILFANVKVKMVNFLPLTQQEGNLLTVAGFSFLLMAGFFALSLLHLVVSLRYSESLKFLVVVLFVIGLIALLMVFADISLLKDIVNQYEEGLEQPEWALLYPILIPQGILVLIFVILHFMGYFNKAQSNMVAVDSNIFLIVQYTGLLCGGMGLAFSILGFIYSRGWSLVIHTIVTNIILALPYGLAVLYWFLVKTHDKSQPLFDEKQRQDVGWSAFLTLIVVSAMMVLVFAVNIHSLNGPISYLWLPLYLFSAILIFSVGNLYFNSKG